MSKNTRKKVLEVIDRLDLSSQMQLLVVGLSKRTTSTVGVVIQISQTLILRL